MGEGLRGGGRVGLQRAVGAHDGADVQRRGGRDDAGGVGGGAGRGGRAAARERGEERGESEQGERGDDRGGAAAVEVLACAIVSALARGRSVASAGDTGSVCGGRE